MSFRQDGGKSHKWNQWLAKHRATLVRTGVPDSIVRDETRWHVFLGHDGWDAESGFAIDMLSVEEARVLLDFLLSEYGREGQGESLCCIQALERRLAQS